MEDFFSVSDDLFAKGCDRIILGCTELSIIKRDYPLGERAEKYIDSLEVLAYSAIRLCGKDAVGFSEGLMEFRP